MTLSLVTGGASPSPEASACPEQMPLFGDPAPVPFSELPSIHDGCRAEDGGSLADELAASDAVALYDELQEELDLLLDGFAPADVPAAAAGMYFDADGRPRTRFRQLRAV